MIADQTLQAFAILHRQLHAGILCGFDVVAFISGRTFLGADTGCYIFIAYILMCNNIIFAG